MTCREFWSRAPELESDRELENHAMECPSCAALLARHQALGSSLQRAAAGKQHWMTPPRVEAKLVTAFREQAAQRDVPANGRRFQMWAAATAVAATLVLAFVVMHWYPKATYEATAVEAEDSAENQSEFILLPAAEGTSESGDVVDVLLPRSALVALGVPSDAGVLENIEDDEAVEAEVLLGQGGVPEAVRVLQ